MMFDLLQKRGFAVEKSPDQEILDLLEQSISFDVEELIGVIEDMYAQPEKKGPLLQILRESLREEKGPVERAALEMVHPDVATTPKRVIAWRPEARFRTDPIPRWRGTGS